MSDRADMVIYHEPDRLEFAGNGKSLGVVRLSEAETVFCSIRNKPAHLRAQLIQNTFDHFITNKDKG